MVRSGIEAKYREAARSHERNREDSVEPRVVERDQTETLDI